MASYRETWNLATIPEPVLLSEMQRRRSAKRTTHRGGRPALPKCACGKYSPAQLARRPNHVCGLPEKQGTIGELEWSEVGSRFTEQDGAICVICGRKATRVIEVRTRKGIVLSLDCLCDDCEPPKDPPEFSPSAPA